MPLEDDSWANFLCLGVCAQQNDMHATIEHSSDNSNGDFQYIQHALASRVHIQGLLRVSTY